MHRRTIIVGIAAIAAGAFAAGVALAPRKQPAEQPQPQAGVLIRDHSPVIGSRDAAVTIVEFLDPSCESCRAFHPYVKQIMASAPKEIRLVIRYAPLHEGSDEAVRILEAARVQDKFLPVLDRLFAAQPSWAVHGAPDLKRAWALAGEAGLDLTKANADARQPAVDRVLELDVADLKAVNLQGTPTFYVNGKPLPSFGVQQLFDLVASELKAARTAAR